MTDETMSSTGSDVNYLLWAVEGAFVSDATYDYMKKSKTSQYNKAALEAALKDETKTADDIDDALHSLRDALSKLEKKTASKLTVKGANKTFKAAALKKKAQSYKAVTVKKAAGKVTCTAKCVNGKSKKALKFSAKTGKITVKKGTKKGTYKMKITVKDAGSAKVKGATKTVTCTVKVK